MHLCPYLREALINGAAIPPVPLRHPGLRAQVEEVGERARRTVALVDYGLLLVVLVPLQNDL